MIRELLAAWAKRHMATHEPTLIIRQFPDPTDIGGQGEPYMVRWNIFKVEIPVSWAPWLGRWLLPDPKKETGDATPRRFELCGLKIHKFVLGDQDRDPHDHPWPFVTMPILGHYVEERWDTRTKSGSRQYLGTVPFGIGYRVLNWHWSTWPLHKVKLPTSWGAPVPAVTLFLHGPRRRVWGYTSGTGRWVPWTEYHGFDVDPASDCENTPPDKRKGVYAMPATDRPNPTMANDERTGTYGPPRVLP